MCPTYISTLFEKPAIKYKLCNHDFTIPRFNTVSSGKCFALTAAVEGSLRQGFFPIHKPDGYAMLTSPNKGQTAIHSRHCPHYMAVRMRGLE